MDNTKLPFQQVQELITQDFLTSALVQVDLISYDRICCYAIDDPLRLFTDTSFYINYHIFPYEQHRQELIASFAYEYDRNRFIRATRLDTLRRKVLAHDHYSFLARIKQANGKEAVLKYTYTRLDDEAHYIVAIRQHVGTVLQYDLLTGGLNRDGLERELKQKFTARPSDVDYDLLFFNVASFSRINGFHSNDGGDYVLQHFYTSLVYSDLHPLSYGRLESDHFVFLIRRDNRDTDVIARLCAQECVYKGISIPYHCYCGIYPMSDYTMSPLAAIDRARIAASHVKDVYLIPWVLFDEVMQRNYISDSDILAHIDAGVDNNEFVPYYQPIVEAQTGHIVMAEALVRWQSSAFGFLVPYSFIPILEKHGGLSRIDKAMEQQVQDTLLERTRLGLPVVPIDLNLSWVDFADVSFIDQIQRHIIERQGTEATCHFEITESSLSEIATNRNDILSIFKKHNIKLIIDDFGEGYSFGSMRDVDFRIIKLDKSLIDKIGVSHKIDLLVETFITMFHKLDAKVVAEGVETEDQLRYLQRVGCDYIQGYYFYRPMSEEDFYAIIDRQFAELKVNGEELPDAPDNTTNGNIWIEREVLEQQYNKLKIKAEEAHHLRNLLGEQGIHYFEWNIETHVDTCSEQFREMYHLPTRKISNMPEVADLCYPDDRKRFRDFYYRSERGERTGTDYFRIFSPDGKTFTWYRKTFYTLFDRDNRPYKAILTMQDMTERFEFCALKERDKLLIRQQDIMTFIYTFADDKLSFSYLKPNGETEMKEIIGYVNTPVEQQTPNQNRLVSTLRNKIKTAQPNETGYIDFFDDYTQTEMRAHYAFIEGKYGHLYAIVGQAEPFERTREHLNQTIRAQQQFINVTQSLHSIFNALTYLNCETHSSRILVLDEAYKMHLSLKMDWKTVARVYTEKILKSEYVEAFSQFMDPDTIDQRIGDRKFLMLEYEDRLLGWIRGYIIPSHRDAEGHIQDLIFASQPFGNEKSTVERLTYLSEIDALTQIRNRFSGEREITEALNSRRAGVFALLDCDHFKAVNDNYGHSVGDKLLQAIADLMRRSNCDGINMRLGGDEFALFLPGTYSDEELKHHFQHLFEAVSQIHFDDSVDLSATISIGAVRYDGQHETDFDSLYRAADTLLYQCKKIPGSHLLL